MHNHHIWPTTITEGHLAKEYDQTNCVSYSLAPQEGSAFVFPPHAVHFTAGREEYTGEVEKIETLEDLYRSRVCIAGDVIITYCTPHLQTTGLQPVDNWPTKPE